MQVIYNSLSTKFNVTKYSNETTLKKKVTSPVLNTVILFR